MPSVFIKCPNTGESVNTGLQLDQAAFDQYSLIDQTLEHCPRCGDSHRWSKPHSYLTNAQPQAIVKLDQVFREEGSGRVDQSD